MNSTSLYDDDTSSGVPKDVVGDDDITNDLSSSVHVHMYELIGSIGLVDNCFVIMVILLSKNMRRKVYNIFILNQSLVDFLGSLFLILDSPLVANKLPPSGIAGHLYCRLWANSYMLWMTFVVSTCNLMMITIDRYIEIVHPFVYKIKCTRNRALIMILLVWVIFAGIEFVVYGLGSTWNRTTRTCILNQNFPSLAVKMVCGVFLFCLIEVSPLVIMTFCYTGMLKKMRNVVPGLQSASELNHRKRQQKIRQNLIVTLITVSVAYFLCVSWNQIYFLLINVGVPLPYDSPFYHFSVYALFTNCIINPFIYTSKYREFQQAVKELSKKICPLKLFQFTYRDDQSGSASQPTEIQNVSSKVDNGQVSS